MAMPALVAARDERIDDCRRGTLYFILQIKTAIECIDEGGPMEGGGGGGQGMAFATVK